MTDASPRGDAPNAVTDPELLLAALEQRAEPPSTTVRERARAQNGRASALLSTPAEAAPPPPPPPPQAGPALRGDEISVRTPRGGVVIKRVRRQNHAV